MQAKAEIVLELRPSRTVRSHTEPVSAGMALVRLDPPEPITPCHEESDFGVPSGFESQKDRVKKQLKTATGWLKLARALLRPSLLKRLASGRIW